MVTKGRGEGWDDPESTSRGNSLGGGMKGKEEETLTCVVVVRLMNDPCQGGDKNSIAQPSTKKGKTRISFMSLAFPYPPAGSDED